MLNRPTSDHPLISAAKCGDIQALKTAMAVEPTPTNKEKDQAFVVAAEYGQLEFVKFLFRYGVNINAVDQHGKSAIMWGIEKRNIALLNFLLADKSIYTFEVDKEQRTLLMLALNFGCTEYIDYAFEHDKYFVSRYITARDKQGKTAIAYAVEKGSAYDFDLLSAQKEVAFDVIDHQGRTLLMLAASAGQHAIVDKLIKRGLSADEKDAGGKTAFIHANGNQAIMTALLVASPGLINIPDASGKTALMLAAERGDSEAVTFLLDHGADQYALDGAGDTALMLAIKKSDKRPIAALLFERADKTQLDLGNLLCFALKVSDLNMFLMLLDYARRINANIVKETPQILHPALEKIVLEQNMVELLQLCQIDVNSVDEQGKTPLMQAICTQNANAVISLIKAGAMVNVSDEEGNTPLIMAAENSNPDILEVLLNNGADVRVVNKKGLSALLIAARWGWNANIKILLHYHLGPPLTPEDIRAADRSIEGRVSTTKVFLAYLRKCAILNKAIACRSLREVEQLISEGVNVNLPVYFMYDPFEDGNYPHLAPQDDRRPIFEATRKHEKGGGIDEPIVHALINAGAEINIADESGVTPWMLAAENGSKWLLELMLSHGANKGWAARNGGTAITSAASRSRPENLENIKYLLEVGVPLSENWEMNVPKRQGQKMVTSALVTYLNERIKMAFFHELSDVELKDVISNINRLTACLKNQKSARKLVRGEIELRVNEYIKALKNVYDVQKIQNETDRMTALAGLDILRKKPKAAQDKSAKQKLFDAVHYVDMLRAARHASDESKALFARLNEWACEKPTMLDIERVMADDLLTKPSEEERHDLERFLEAMLNNDERKLLKKNVYDAIEKWSKKYKPEEDISGIDDGSDQPAPQLIIEQIKERYDEYKQNPQPFLCILFEILRTSESGRANVDTGTWKDFVSVMENGNYLKKHADSLGLFARIKVLATKSEPSEHEGMLPMVSLRSGRGSDESCL